MWKKTFGYYPLFCLLDNYREVLARAGAGGPGRVEHHRTVLNAAVEQIPDIKTPSA